MRYNLNYAGPKATEEAISTFVFDNMSNRVFYRLVDLFAGLLERIIIRGKNEDKPFLDLVRRIWFGEGLEDM